MPLLRGTACCGIKELHDLQEGVDVDDKMTVKDAILDLKSEMRDTLFAYVFFSTSDDPQYEGNMTIGRELAAFIKKNRLGLVKTFRPRKNPNSGHNVQMWTWAVDRDALRKYKFE